MTNTNISSNPTSDSFGIAPATKTTKTELLNSMRAEAMRFVDLSTATRIGSSEYAIPVVGGYVTITITAKNPTSTEKVPAFNLEAAVAKYNSKLAEKAEKAAAREAEKAAKKAEKEAAKADA